jgi:hypothetical protein
MEEYLLNLPKGNSDCEQGANVVDGQPVSLLECVGIAAHSVLCSIIVLTMLVQHGLNSIISDRASSVLKVSHIGLVCVFRHECVGKCAQVYNCKVVVTDKYQEGTRLQTSYR